MIRDQIVKMMRMLSGPSQLLQLLLILLTTSLPGVTAAYDIDIGLAINTPIGAAITAVFMTLIVVAVLSYFYRNLKEQTGTAAGQSIFTIMYTICLLVMNS